MKKIVGIVILIAVFVIAFFVGSERKIEDNLWENAVYTADTQFGTGEKTIEVEVIAGEKSVTFTLKTNKETVGEALSEHKLISGEKGPYGLYVKVVNGIVADYDKNQSYWEFTKGGNYLNTGVDQTEAQNGEHYELTYTK